MSSVSVLYNKLAFIINICIWCVQNKYLNTIFIAISVFILNISLAQMLNATLSHQRQSPSNISDESPVPVEQWGRSSSISANTQRIPSSAVVSNIPTNVPSSAGQMSVPVEAFDSYRFVAALTQDLNSADLVKWNNYFRDMC